ncbi:MAG: alpha/beta hydrolase [Pseudomonadota bacterium]
MIANNLQKLEKRFIPPSNWIEDYFENENTNHRIRYCYVKSEQGKGTILLLPGLSEFSEKYIETTCYLNGLGYSVYILDWCFQGKSTRLKDNYQKRHSNGYGKDLDDLNSFLNQLHTNTPLFIMAHSMGAHIILRYLAQHKNNIKAASLSAPMLMPLAFKNMMPIYSLILKLMPSKYMTNYVWGGTDWVPNSRQKNGLDIFSSDPIRDKIHDYWSECDPSLRVGSPTFGWVQETIKSIRLLEENISNIKTPLLLSMAEKDLIVDNKTIKKAAQKLQKAKLTNIKNAKHEILMETDQIRSQFLEESINLFENSK